MGMITKPTDRQTYEGKIATYWMVSKPGLSKFIMNILFALKKPPIPIKSFTDDKEAKEWLRSYM